MKVDQALAVALQLIDLVEGQIVIKNAVHVAHVALHQLVGGIDRLKVTFIQRGLKAGGQQGAGLGFARELFGEQRGHIARIITAQHENGHHLLIHAVGADIVQEFGPGVAHTLEGRGVLLLHLFLNCIEDGEMEMLMHSRDQIQLVAEVPVDGAARQPGRRGDLLQRGGVDAARIKNLDRGFDDFAARFEGLLFGGPCHCYFLR